MLMKKSEEHQVSDEGCYSLVADGAVNEGTTHVHGLSTKASTKLLGGVTVL
jgi:hypothetical protein